MTFAYKKQYDRAVSRKEFTGTYSDYLSMEYEAYLSKLRMISVRPMTQAEWMERVIMADDATREEWGF